MVARRPVLVRLLLLPLLGGCGCGEEPDTSPPAAPSPPPPAWDRFETPEITIEIPPGWDAGREDGSGLLVLRGPDGARIEIQPLFFPGPPLRPRQAERWIEHKLKDRFPDADWDPSPPAAGGTVRRIGRDGNQRVIGFLTASPSDAGTAILDCRIAAPEVTYASSEETFAKILESLRLRGAPVNDAGSAEPEPAFTRWTDPNERAFSMEVPQGWMVSGGTVRPTALLVQASVEARSPDGGVTTSLGDRFPVYVEPNPTLAYAGIGAGGTYVDPMGGRWPVQPYTPGAEYVRRFLLPTYPGPVEVTDVVPRDDIGDTIARLGGIPSHAGEIRYRFERDGTPMTGHALCITSILASPTGRAWQVWRLYRVEAPLGRLAEGEAAMRRMAATFRIDPNWQRAQQQGDADRSRAIAAMGESVARTIRETYESRRETESAIDRRRSNAILEIEEVVDPVTGERLRVESGASHYWIDPAGRVVGTETDALPDVDFRALVRLP